MCVWKKNTSVYTAYQTTSTELAWNPSPNLIACLLLLLPFECFFYILLTFFVCVVFFYELPWHGYVSDAWVYVCVWVKAFHVYDSVLFALVWFGIAKVHLAECEWFECQHRNDIIYRFLFQNSHIQCLKGKEKRKKNMISLLFWQYLWMETNRMSKK